MSHAMIGRRPGPIRLVAVAFTELAEGSATLERLGEARSTSAHGAYLDAVREATEAVGGQELTEDGDDVLSVFDSATAALQYAVSAQRRCERAGRRLGERLDVRVGIEVGETASDEQADVTAGIAAARASALARAARPGGILASAVAAGLATPNDVTFEPAGLVELDGSGVRLAAVDAVWEPSRAHHLPLPPELGSHASRSSFVGRAAERVRLEAVWRNTLSGERALAFVTGEPGIGKTRLVGEFARTVHAQGGTVLWGRSFEEALTPYQPFVQALLHYIHNAPAAELREQVGVAGDVLARLLPELPLRVPVREAPGVDPESERYRLFEAIGRLLVAASTDRPLLLVLDDLQWADHGTLLLLKHLAIDHAAASLLLLGIYRESEVGREHPLSQLMADVERERVVDRVELTGLAEEELSSLVGSLIGLEPSREAARSLRSETEGNPFFVEELVRHLGLGSFSAERGRLLRIHTAVHELGVPARVRELVSRRVQRLSAAARTALSAASVIGSEFKLDVLAAILDADPDELVRSLDEGVEAGLLIETRDRIGQYRFSHALVQQTLYEELTVNRRAALHQRSAAALEHLHTDERVQHSELAYHYARAGERYAAKVVGHARSAAEDALRLFAYEDAVRAVSTALEALDALGRRDGEERAEFLALLGTAYTRAGDYLKARDAFHQATEMSAAASAWPLLAQAVLGYGGGSAFGGVWTTFAAVDEELVRLLELALTACPPGDSLERVRLLGRLAQALYWSPETRRGLALSEEALSIARRLGDPAALAYALDSRHVVLWSPEHLTEGRALAEEMLEIGRRLGDRDIQLEALAWLITDALEVDPIATVDAFIAEHARIAAELRQPYHLWYTEAARAMRAHLDGRFEEAAALSEKAYSYGQASHGENARQTYLVQTMFIKLDQGRMEDLIDGLREYVAASPLLAWRTALALALAGLDRRDEALREVAWFAQRGFDSIRMDCIWMTSMVMLARTAAHFDAASDAAALHDLLAPFADRNCVVGGAVLSLGPISRILGMLDRAAGRPDAALEHFADALPRCEALGSPPLIARTQVEAAKALLLRGADGDQTEAERLLEAARATAAEIGMEKLLRDVNAVREAFASGAVG